MDKVKAHRSDWIDYMLLYESGCLPTPQDTKDWTEHWEHRWVNFARFMDHRNVSRSPLQRFAAWVSSRVESIISRFDRPHR